MGRQGLTFTAAMLVGIALGLGGFAIYLALPASRAHEFQRLEVEIGSVRLRLDRALARFDDQRRGGRLDRLDLAVLLPDFRPAGRLSDLGVPLNSSELSKKMVFLSLTLPEGNVDPADRFVKLYARFLSPDQSEGPAGLVKRQFESNTPFADADLYLSPPEGRQFAARCQHRPVEGPLPDICLWEFWRDGIAVHLRFSPAALADWQGLKARSEALVASLTH
jgi:hypothetical protein